LAARRAELQLGGAAWRALEVDRGAQRKARSAIRI
jgi:hypothetical protein